MVSVWCLSASIVQAQPASPVQPPPLARVEAVPAKPAKRGAAVTLVVNVTPRDGIHIYAPPQKDFKPITLTMERAEGVRIASPQFPPAAMGRFNGEQLRVYDKAFSITIPVVLSRSAQRGTTLTGTLSYQACDDLVCYRPVNVPVRWEIQLQ
jgi:DsbC/DsbD-like thiol-disulfide interchange protein